MQEVARFHIGDFVEVFHHGSLVMQGVDESATKTNGCILYGTVHGSLGTKEVKFQSSDYSLHAIFSGLVTGLDSSLFELLFELQTKLATVIKSVGQIDHDFYRNFRYVLFN